MKRIDVEEVSNGYIVRNSWLVDDDGAYLEDYVKVFRTFQELKDYIEEVFKGGVNG